MENIYSFQITWENLLIILLCIFFLLYLIYWRRINNFLLWKIDFIIVSIFLAILFYFILNPSKTILWLLLWILAFFSTFLQFRKGIENRIILDFHEKIQKKSDKNEIFKAINDLLNKYDIYEPFIPDKRNIEMTIINKIDTFFKNKTIDYKAISDLAFQNRHRKNQITRLLALSIKEDEKWLRQLNWSGETKIKEKRHALNWIHEIFDKHYKKETYIDKILKFLNP